MAKDTPTAAALAELRRLGIRPNVRTTSKGHCEIKWSRAGSSHILVTGTKRTDPRAMLNAVTAIRRLHRGREQAP